MNLRNPDLVRTAMGVEVRLHGEWATEQIRKTFYDFGYETHELAILEGSLRPDDRFLEGGAGIGVVSTYAASIVGAERVRALEANPALIAVARDTASRNGRGAITFVHALLGDVERTGVLYVDRQFWSSSIDDQAGRVAQEVPVTTLWTQLKEFRATYLMLDIEGAEIEVLSGRDLPRFVRAVCVEVHPWLVGAEPVQRLVVRLIEQGLYLSTELSRSHVLLFERKA